MILILLFSLLLYFVAATYDLIERRVPRWIWLIVLIITIIGLLIDYNKPADVIMSLTVSGLMAAYLWKIKSGKADVIAVLLLGLLYPQFAIPLIICFLAFFISVACGMFIKTWKDNIPFIVPLIASMILVTLWLVS